MTTKKSNKTVDLADLLNQAKLTHAKRGRSGARFSAPVVKFESNGNGRPRISFNTSMKAQLIEDGTFNRYVQIRVLDQRKEDRSSGQIMVFFTFKDTNDDAVSITNAVDKNGQIIRENVAYINCLGTVARSVGILPQEFYTIVPGDEVTRIENQPTYMVSIPVKTQEEVDALVASDASKEASAE